MTSKEWWTLARGVNVVMGIVTVPVGALIVGGIAESDVGIPIALHTASVASFMCGWNALNDILDSEGDRINHPNRPLASGAISILAAKRFSMATFAISALTLIGIIIHAEMYIGRYEWLDSVAIWFTALFLMTSYEFDGIPFSPSLKKRGLLGNLSVSGLIAVVIVFGAASVGQGTDPLPWLVAVCTMMIGTAREIIKDVEDMDGDSSRETLPMKIGPEKARAIAWLCALLGFISMGLPFALDLFSKTLIGFLGPAMFYLLMVKAPIAKGEDTKASRMLKRSLLFGLFGFTACGIITHLG